MTTHVATAAIRPAAVLHRDAAAVVLGTLQEQDVSRGGVWKATPGVWQRYDRPWSGAAGSRGGAELLGTLGVVYDRPAVGEIAFCKVTLTAAGRQLRFTEESLCDEALGFAGLNLATVTRADLDAPDAVQVPAQRSRSLAEILNTDVGELISPDTTVGKVLNADVGKILRKDVRALIGVRRQHRQQ